MTIDMAQILAAVRRGPDLREIYGTCDAEPCFCRRTHWLGQGCKNWRPMGPATQADLAAWHRAAWTLMSPPITTGETKGERACT